MTLFWSKLFYKCTVMTFFRHNTQSKCATITLFPHMPLFQHQRVGENPSTGKKQNAFLAAIKDKEIALQSSIKKTMEDKLQHILSHQDLVSMAYDYYPSSAKTTQNDAASAMGQQVCLRIIS